MISTNTSFYNGLYSHLLFSPPTSQHHPFFLEVCAQTQRPFINYKFGFADPVLISATAELARFPWFVAIYV